MASIKVKFRASANPDKRGFIYYQIIQNRVIRQLKTNHSLLKQEWEEISKNSHICHLSDIKNQNSIIKSIHRDLIRLNSIISSYETMPVKYSANDIIITFQRQTADLSFFNFMHNIISHLNQIGKYRTSETYSSTLRSFMRFRNGKDIMLDEINSDLMLIYEAYLHSNGISKNSSSFYMRILRATYNRAVEKGLTTAQNPFKHVYTGIDKTIKRSISIKEIKQIKALELSHCPNLDFARDLFLFSFYTRGMSFIDMAYLKKSNINNGSLAYRRHKTGQLLIIKWEKCMQEIINKYESNQSGYLLPIIKNIDIDERQQYRNTLRLVNNKLKEIAKILKLPIMLTTYVARHTWANVAKDKKIPLSVISEGMGHNSEKTTQIYLASLDTSTIDNANKLILKEL